MTLGHDKKCKRCGEPTKRAPMANCCWGCKPIIETENRHKREKKARKLQNKMKGVSQ